jgi:hypothetical protein
VLLSRLLPLTLVFGAGMIPALIAQEVKPFTLQRVELHQYEDGPPVIENYVWMPGETVHLSFLISGYKGAPGDKIGLSYKIDAIDPKGVKLIETVTGKVDAELATEDKDWLPKVRGTIPVPPLADTGDYKILISAKDELGGTSTEKEVSFHVKGRDVEPSDHLVVRNFRFLHAEEDKAPMVDALYHPGDPVWARFEITGYKLGESNRYDVEYGLSVLTPAGQAIYSQPQAAVEQNKSFYPKRYVLGVLNLNTRPDTKPGQYTILLTVKDNVGGQTSESKYSFRIE